MAIEELGVDKKYVQESAYEGEIEVDEVVEKVVKRRKYHNVPFRLGAIISHEEIK